MTTKRTLTDAERAEARALIVAFCSSGVYRIAGSADRMSDDALASWLDVRDKVADPLLAKLGETYHGLDDLAFQNVGLAAALDKAIRERAEVRRDRDRYRDAFIRIKRAVGEITP